MTFPLTIIAGANAQNRLAADGWQPELFGAMVGASGGAKLLGIAHLDRYLFTEFLSRSEHPMELYGSSIGSWRHAALASASPDTAIEQLQNRYLNQKWDENDPRSPREIVDGLCAWVLDGYLDEDAINSVMHHPRFTTHIITARGRGLNNRSADWLLALGMGASALGNLLYRDLLSLGFQRIVFSSGSAKAFRFTDFQTEHVPLTAELLKPALTASGSIPFLMNGVHNPATAPAGQYWDGGVIDYHFDFVNQTGDGLVFYPHFGPAAIKGWFDKKIPWRKNSLSLLNNTIMVAPSIQYLRQLPGGKIPDRKDFTRYSEAERLENWNAAVESSKQLAEAFDEVVSHPDPLHFVQRH